MATPRAGTGSGAVRRPIRSRMAGSAAMIRSARIGTAAAAASDPVVRVCRERCATRSRCSKLRASDRRSGSDTSCLARAASRRERDKTAKDPRPVAMIVFETPMPPAEADLFSDTLTWLRQHLPEPVTVASLAERAAMSPRTFARRFLASTGTTPLRWLLAERLRLAQRLLETTGLPVAAIARQSGFGTADNLRKHFSRTVRTTPQSYRRAFQA